jgi:nitrite reductase/ring-hydroxylating ferredoxin subunit
MKDQIARSIDVQEGGLAVRFSVVCQGVVSPAILIRYEGGVSAYLNRCAHLGIELDIRAGYVFSRKGDTLICAAHGAEYGPDDGRCVSGPCFGDPLSRLGIREEAGNIFLDDPAYGLPEDRGNS